MGTGVTMADLARMLEPFTEQRTVRDCTGLTGRYDVQLTWTPDRLGPLHPNAPEEVVRAREAIDPNGPALSTALREQLGLRLEPKKDKVDVLVIARVERPTEN
jgi:bla regulator protein blaR1